MLSTGCNVFEALGSGYTLLAFDADDSAVRGFEQAARSLKVPLKLVRDSCDNGREAYVAKLILVRPDQYVAWCGDTAPADTRALLSRIAGFA